MGISASALLAIVALVVSVRSLTVQEESARVAVISAEAAQRANWLTEQRMLHEATNAPRPGDAVWDGAQVSRRDRPPTSDVRWSLDRKGKHTFVLRNVGTGVAAEVQIPPEGAAQISRGLLNQQLCVPRNQ